MDKNYVNYVFYRIKKMRVNTGILLNEVIVKQQFIFKSKVHISTVNFTRTNSRLILQKPLYLCHVAYGV